MSGKDPRKVVSRRDAERIIAGAVATASFAKVSRASASPVAATPNIVFIACERRYASTERELRERMEELRRELGDADPPGPAPTSLPCGDGVNTGYGPPA